MNKPEVDYKIVILSRFCGKFLPATESTATVRKTSTDILIDLRPMADYTPDEISAYMAVNGYSIGFDGDIPIWLMQTNEPKAIE